MFIKSNRKTLANGKKYISHFLVEGYREKETGKIKHRNLINLSRLDEKSILVLKESLKGNSVLPKVRLEDLEVLSSKQYGNIALFSKLYDQYFSKYFKKNKNYNQSIKSIIINKIFDPKSKNSLNNWIKQTDLKKINNKNNLYESLDCLELNQEIIEKDLSKNNSTKKNNQNNILLYDITSTYFEGKGAENICKYGYSRDHRSDRVQVNIGVITSNDGTPIAVEIIEGNISDKQTLQGQIDKIKNKFNIKDLTFVFDRGMKSKINLEYIKKEGYEYITALSHQELKSKAEESKSIQMSIFDKRDIASFEIGDRFYSLCHNPVKADRDKINRDKLIDKTIEELIKIQDFKRKYSPKILQDKVSKKINKRNMEKYITYNIEDIKENIINKKTKKEEIKISGKLTFSKNTEKITNDEKYDGFYMIESTNKNITKENSVKQYKDLQLVERVFNSIKNHIEIRPIFHYKESRIKGHIFSCFMSYFLLHKFKQIASELLKYNSLDDLLTEISNIHKVTFRIDKFCFDRISDLNELQSEILKEFQIPLSVIR